MMQHAVARILGARTIHARGVRTRVGAGCPRAIACVSGAALLASCAPSLDRYEFREVHMGCDARVVLMARDRAAAVEAARAAFHRMEELDAVLSDWRFDSEVERIGEALDRSPLPFVVVMSPLLERALHCSLCVHEATGGRFDPALGSLTRLWRRHRSEGPAPSAAAVPSDAEIESARRTSGALHLAVRGSELTLRTHGVRFDFGGIGKGLAADAALEAVRGAGCTSAFVQIAGDCAAGDPPPGLNGWRVRIAATGEVVELRASDAISSSGDLEQWNDFEGERRSHILDPATGLGARGAPGVTVIVRGRSAASNDSACSSCGPAALADGIATAATLMSDAERAALQRRFSEIRLIVTPRTPAAEPIVAPQSIGEISTVTPSPAARESTRDPAGARK